MIYDEGLRSYKAIAFIQSKNRKPRVNFRTFSYLLLGAILQRTILSQTQKILREFSKKSRSEKLWIK